MKTIVPFSSLAFLFGLASMACSAGDPGADGSGNEALESVGTKQQALPVCVGRCRADCLCLDRPSVCFPLCGRASTCGASDGCGGFCSSGSCPSGTSCGGAGIPNQCGCPPSCSAKACGAADGCGGICSSGSCPAGGVCGGAGVTGSCAQPDLEPFVDGTLIGGGSVKHAEWTVRIYNLSPVPVSNLEISIMSNLGATLLSDTIGSGFACHHVSNLSGRLNVSCVGGTISAHSNAMFTLTTALSASMAPTPSAYHVLSVNADPNNAIVEVFEHNNLGNDGVLVP